MKKEERLKSGCKINEKIMESNKIVVEQKGLFNSIGETKEKCQNNSSGIFNMIECLYE